MRADALAACTSLNQQLTLCHVTIAKLSASQVHYNYSRNHFDIILRDVYVLQLD
jgi:hypothetical protein